MLDYPPAFGTLALQTSGSFTYTPLTNYSGTVTFGYRAIRDGESSVQKSVTIQVTSVPDAPIANNDVFEMSENGRIERVSVLANDSDVDSSTLTAYLESGPQHGTLVLLNTGLITYEPHPGFVGDDEFRYRAFDGGLLSQVATVRLEVFHLEPIASEDYYTGLEDTTFYVDASCGVLADDYDTQNHLLTARIFGSAPAGVTLQTDGSFSVIPPKDFVGEITFFYRVSDPLAIDAEARVTINFESVDDLPQGIVDVYVTEAGVPLLVETAVPPRTIEEFNATVRRTSFQVAQGATKIDFSPRALAAGRPRGLLFVNTVSSIAIYDGETGELLSIRVSDRGSFHDMDVSPSGRFLFVSDFGGETANGDPVEPSYVHRYDAVTGTWRVKTAPKVASKIRALDDDRLFLSEEEYSRGYILNRFNSGNNAMTQVALLVGGPGWEIEYNHRMSRVYFGNSGAPQPRMDVYRVVGNDIALDHRSQTDAPFALSADGRHVYSRRFQRNAADSSEGSLEFPERILAEASGLAFAPGKVYSAATAQLLGSTNISGSVFATTPADRHVWILTAAGSVHHLEMPEVGVLRNDADVDAVTLAAVLDAGPAHGTLTFNADGTFAYVPNAGFVGVDTFRYHATDGVADSAQILVRIGVGTVMPADIVNDVNLDGAVSAVDLGVIVSNCGATVDLDNPFDPLSRADLNRDRRINLRDAILVRNAITTHASASQAAAVVANGATRARAVASRRASVESRLSAVAVDEVVTPLASELGVRRTERRAVRR